MENVSKHIFSTVKTEVFDVLEVTTPDKLMSTDWIIRFLNMYLTIKRNSKR